MSCFHKSYTQWKLAHGIIDEETANRLLNFSENSRLDQEQEMNRRSTMNQTHEQLKNLSWLNETLSDLTDLLLPNVTDWKMGNSSKSQSVRNEDNIQQLAANDEDLASIFKLYEMALEIAGKEIKDGNMEESVNTILLEQLISNQKVKFKDELSLIINDEYFVIDRPYGVLVYSSGLDQHISVDKYLANFYLKTTKDIIQILRLTETSFTKFGDVPDSIKNFLFNPAHLL